MDGPGTVRHGDWDELGSHCDATFVRLDLNSCSSIVMACLFSPTVYACVLIGMVISCNNRYLPVAGCRLPTYNG